MKKHPNSITVANLGYVEKLIDIPVFLFNMFNDYHIIPLKQPLRAAVALTITLIRAKETYKILKKAKSPLKEITELQAEKLSRAVGIPANARFAYSKPFVKREQFTIPMFNFFSFTTHGKVLKNSKKIAPPFCVFAEFFELVERKIESAYKQCKGNCAVLLSAHSLPLKLLEKTKDPYRHDLEVILNYLKKRLKKPVYLSFQSKLGPVKWLEPSTEQMIKRLSKKYRSILIFPISFAAENTETVYEIDKIYKDVARKLKIELIRVSCFNDSEEFIELLKTVCTSFNPSHRP